ncbi:hypothetical protein BLA29_000063 [Euroglyphus maynei]|uniref:Uncharacterized protein n=1 Tax=Euroglyphus maynei TaxID=6958 RepID=A0A1Y3AWM2_EURMA|nr:hypothetical protein BLA29_000063 [Euroglyphus maynei]
MDKIIHGLYIGNIRDSKNHEQLKINSITHIISILDTENINQIEVGNNIIDYCIIVNPDEQ